jgi:hypothetical protein
MLVINYFALDKVFQMEFNNYSIPYGIMTVVFLKNIDEHQYRFRNRVVFGILGTLFGRSIARSSWKARGILYKREHKIPLNYRPQFSSQFIGLKIIKY